MSVGWTESNYQAIAKDALALLWDYCNLLAGNMDAPFLRWWNGRGAEMRAESLAMVRASNGDDVTDVAGFVSEYRHFLQDTDTDTDLMFWLTETVAQIHNHLKAESAHWESPTREETEP